MVPAFMKLNLVPGSTAQKLQRADWLGNAIFIAATTSFLIPMTWVGVQYPWSSWHTLVPLLIGVAGIVGFIIYEKCVAAEPTIRLSLLGSYNMANSLFTALINALIV